MELRSANRPPDCPTNRGHLNTEGVKGPDIYLVSSASFVTAAKLTVYPTTFAIRLAACSAMAFFRASATVNSVVLPRGILIGPSLRTTRTK